MELVSIPWGSKYEVLFSANPKFNQSEQFIRVATGDNSLHLWLTIVAAEKQKVEKLIALDAPWEPLIQSHIERSRQYAHLLT